MKKTVLNEEREWCPTQAGTFTGYDPEFFNGIEWLSVPVDYVPDGYGVKYPKRNGGILSTIFLCGRSQAEVLAWSFSASAEAQGGEVKVRVQKYEIKYDIKAKKINA